MVMMDGHLRVRLKENRISREPYVFDAPLAVSPSCSSESSSSSDLDTESTGSFHENGITLGHLIGLQSGFGGQEGISSAEIPARNSKRKWWSLCGNADDCHENNLVPSLGQFLEVERRAAAFSRRERTYCNVVYGDHIAGETNLGTNPLFGHGRIRVPEVPPDPSSMPLPLPSPPEWFPADRVRSRGAYTRDYTLGSRSHTLIFDICRPNLAVRMWVWVRRFVSGKHVKCS